MLTNRWMRLETILLTKIILRLQCNQVNATSDNEVNTASEENHNNSSVDKDMQPGSKELEVQNGGRRIQSRLSKRILGLRKLWS